MKTMIATNPDIQDYKENPLIDFIEDKEKFKAELRIAIKEMPLGSSLKVLANGEIIVIKKQESGEIEVVDEKP